MENIDSLKRGDEVKVTIWGPDGDNLYQFTGSGFHNLDMAIKSAVSNAALDINPEDCVFEVNNMATNVSHKYRLNAHGHLKLII